MKRAEELKGLPTKTIPLLSKPYSDKGRSSFYSPGSGLKKEEIEILKNSSLVNGRIFLPWVDNDFKENFKFDKPYRYLFEIFVFFLYYENGCTTNQKKTDMYYYGIGTKDV